MMTNNEFNNAVYESNNLTIFIDKQIQNNSKNYNLKEFNIKTKLDIIVDFCGTGGFQK
jgi:hypothetical protein